MRNRIFTSSVWWFTRNRDLPSAFHIALGLVVAATCWLSAGSSHAQLSMPNAHVHYAVELEPHVILQWNDDPYFQNDGIGLGFRASIPLLDNGPISSINNSLAIGFGLDWAHYGDCGPYGDACGDDEFLIPIVLQWNFFVTRWLSLFPEFGLAIRHASLAWGGPVPPDCVRARGINVCRDGVSVTDVEPVLWFGARFAIHERIAFTLRLGTPSILLGASFML